MCDLLGQMNRTDGVAGQIQTKKAIQRGSGDFGESEGKFVPFELH